MKLEFKSLDAKTSHVFYNTAYAAVLSIVLAAIIQFTEFDSFLFSTTSRPEYTKGLGSGAFPNSLAQLFQENSISLSDNTAIVTVIEGRQWLIDSQYIVKQNDNKLSIYQHAQTSMTITFRKPLLPWSLAVFIWVIAVTRWAALNVSQAPRPPLAIVCLLLELMLATLSGAMLLYMFFDVSMVIILLGVGQIVGALSSALRRPRVAVVPGHAGGAILPIHGLLAYCVTFQVVLSVLLLITGFALHPDDLRNLGGDAAIVSFIVLTVALLLEIFNLFDA